MDDEEIKTQQQQQQQKQMERQETEKKKLSQKLEEELKRAKLMQMKAKKLEQQLIQEKEQALKEKLEKNEEKKNDTATTEKEEGVAVSVCNDTKYASISSLEERAFQILVDLNAIELSLEDPELTPDPEEFAPNQINFNL